MNRAKRLILCSLGLLFVLIIIAGCGSDKRVYENAMNDEDLILNISSDEDELSILEYINLSEANESDIDGTIWNSDINIESGMICVSFRRSDFDEKGKGIKTWVGIYDSDGRFRKCMSTQCNSDIYVAWLNDNLLMFVEKTSNVLAFDKYGELIEVYNYNYINYENSMTSILGARKREIGDWTYELKQETIFSGYTSLIKYNSNGESYELVSLKSNNDYRNSSYDNAIMAFLTLAVITSIIILGIYRSKNCKKD